MEFKCQLFSMLYKTVVSSLNFDRFPPPVLTTTTCIQVP